MRAEILEQGMFMERWAKQALSESMESLWGKKSLRIARFQLPNEQQQKNVSVMARSIVAKNLCGK